MSEFERGMDAPALQVSAEERTGALSVVGKHTRRREWADMCKALGLIADPLSHISRPLGAVRGKH